MANDEPVGKSDAKMTQGRSPAYPFIPLKAAIERAIQVHEAGVGRHAYPPGSFYKIWEIGPKSSSARQVMAALNHFGLVEYDGRGTDRKVKFSDLALKIVQDKRPDSQDRLAAIQKAALTPPIHRQIYQEFPPPLPDDVFLEHFLVSVAGYNEGGANSLIKEYKDTMAFAGLDKPGEKLSVSETGAHEGSGHTEHSAAQVKVGDSIQWTSSGVDQFKVPATVLGLSDDGNWVFTDQGDAAVPIKEIKILDTQTDEGPGIVPPPPPPHVLAAMQKSRSSESALGEIHEGTSILTSGKLKSGSFEVRVKGEIGAIEIGKIIKLLEAQKHILSDEEDEATNGQ